MKLISLIIFPILFFILPLSALAQKDRSNTWTLQKDEDGIRIFMRRLAGKGIRELKCIITLNVYPYEIIALIKDTDAGPKWVDRMASFKTLKEISSKEWYTYSEISIPWPFSNRDIVTHNLITQNPQTKIVTIALNAKPDFIPEKKGKVRINGSGSWVVTPLTETKTEVSYTFWSSSGSSILPASLTNSIVVKSMFTTFKNMKRKVEERKYKNKSFSEY